MRKTVTILLLSTFLVNSIGYVGFYAITRLQIVHEISELIEHNDTGAYSELVLSKEDMNPARGYFIRMNSHEFRYRGKMYDVVSQHKMGDQIRFTVIHDQKDEANFDQLAANTNSQVLSDSNPKEGNHLLLDIMVKNLFSPLYFPSQNNTGIKQKIHSLAVLPGFDIPEVPYQQVPSPPPQA